METKTRKIPLLARYLPVSCLLFLFGCHQKEVDLDKKETISSNYMFVPLVKLDISADTLFKEILGKSKNSKFSIKEMANNDLAVETAIQSKDLVKPGGNFKFINSSLGAKGSTNLLTGGSSITIPAFSSGGSEYFNLNTAGKSKIQNQFDIYTMQYNQLTKLSFKKGTLRIKFKLEGLTKETRIEMDLTSVQSTSDANLGKRTLNLDAWNGYTSTVDIDLANASLKLGEIAVGQDLPTKYNTFEAEFNALVKKPTSGTITIPSAAKLSYEIAISNHELQSVSGVFQDCTGCDNNTTSDDVYTSKSFNTTQSIDGFGTLDGFQQSTFNSGESYLAFKSISTLATGLNANISMEAVDKNNTSLDKKEINPSLAQINIPNGTSVSNDTMKDISAFFGNNVNKILVKSAFKLPRKHGTLNPDNLKIDFNTKAFIPLKIVDLKGSSYTSKLDFNLKKVKGKINGLILHFSVNNKLGMELSIEITYKTADGKTKSLSISPATQQAKSNESVFIASKALGDADQFTDYTIRIPEAEIDHFINATDVNLKVKYRTNNKGVQFNTKMKFQIGISTAFKLSDI